MLCPFCGECRDRVVETRPSRSQDRINRRRECLDCGARYSTIEQIKLDHPMIEKRDGRRERFNESKLLSGISTACAKRPISQKEIQELVEEISIWVKRSRKPALSSKDLGEKVVQSLKKLDPVAYVRYSSVQNSFEDISEFVNTLQAENNQYPNG